MSECSIKLSGKKPPIPKRPSFKEANTLTTDMINNYDSVNAQTKSEFDLSALNKSVNANCNLAQVNQNDVFMYVQRLNEMIKENSELTAKLSKIRDRYDILKSKYKVCKRILDNKSCFNYLDESKDSQIEDLLYRLHTSRVKSYRTKVKGEICSFQIEIPSIKKAVSCNSSIPTPQEISSIPSNLGIPKVPNIPVTGTNDKSASSMPFIPNVPKVPAIPNVPGLSNIPKIPNIPGIPNIPSIPGGVPFGIPNIPKIPGVPGIPNIPGMIGNKIGMTQISQKLNPSIKVSSNYDKKEFIRFKINLRKVPESKLKSTLWKDFPDFQVPDFFTGEYLDTHFSRPRPKEEDKKLSRSGSFSGQSETQKLISILDAKRSHNLSILYSRFKYSSDDLASILQKFDCDVLE